GRGPRGGAATAPGGGGGTPGPEAGPPSQGPGGGAAAGGRGTAGRQTRGRGAAPRRRREETGVRGSSREATACHRGVECLAKVSRQSARHSRERLCRRREAADDRHTADLDTGRLLLLRSSLERGRVDS